MFKGIGVTLLALLATVAARPDPQFLYSPGTYYGTALSAAYNAAPAPVVSAAVPASTFPIQAISGLYSFPSLVSSYAYGYQSTVSEVPVVNPSASLLYNSAYTSLPYQSLPYAPSYLAAYGR